MSVPATGASARFPVRRAAEKRHEPGLIDTLRADASTLAIVVARDRVPVAAAGVPALRLAFAVDVSADAWALLGDDLDGTAVLVALAAEGGEVGPTAPLREIAGLLPADEAEAATTAVAVAGWLRDHAFCPFCGTRADLIHAGWARRCPHCGREHFPRTDPAIIVAVADADDPDRLLLGSNAAWPSGRYSCFAGFAEAGESLEHAAVREVAEEAGVELIDLRYRGSQAWPYPRSLMLGFHAVARVADVARPDGDEIVDVRWFRRAEIGDALRGAGEITLPGPASIARRLIVEWFEGRA